jgi:hypothetical protein
MPCRPYPIPGGVAIVCGRGQRSKPCATVGCGGRGDFLCDYPLAGKASGRTCDRAMCERCRRPQRKGVDYCGPHASMQEGK